MIFETGWLKIPWPSVLAGLDTAVDAPMYVQFCADFLKMWWWCSCHVRWEMLHRARRYTFSAEQAATRKINKGDKDVQYAHTFDIPIFR